MPSPFGDKFGSCMILIEYYRLWYVVAIPLPKKDTHKFKTVVDIQN